MKPYSGNKNNYLTRKGVSMTDVIEVHPMAACLTITFLNQSFEQTIPTVWVCTNRDTYDRALVKLQGMNHIKIIQHGATHVEGVHS